ncbi:MAG TPA: hypothetical protein VGQ75_10385 [Thermoanaerobaculia bacterium]|nr:hypothetical protein [Thermoanaerobaculia bacterium]HEV8608862.1 hypothetical protein [Thermoanaerobaculia bacterium]
MSVPAVVLRWLERQVGRTVTLRDGRKATLRLVDACSGELSLCLDVPGSGIVWVGLDEKEALAPEVARERRSAGTGAA